MISRLSAVVTTIALIGSLCAACGRATAPSRSTASSTSGHILLHGLLLPQVASTSAGLYVAWQVSRLGDPPISELARVNSTTGRIEATRRLGAAFDQAVAVGGSLYVGISTTSSKPGEALLRLNARTLVVTRRWSDLEGGGSLALAGGGLWVAGEDRLLRLSLSEGNAIASVSLPGANRSDVASNATGRRPWSWVRQTRASVPSTARPENGESLGLLLSNDRRVSAPEVAEVIGQGVWVSEATGMMGYVERFDAATLTPDPSTMIEGSNGISASVANGLLWVSQIPEGGRRGTSCGNPLDGAVLAPLNLPSNSPPLAIGRHDLYYLTTANPAGAQQTHMDVNEEPIPAACRVG